MKKRGQVWIETVLYTLIALVLIGIVLAFITPKLNDARDKAVVEQTIGALNVLDEKVAAVLRAPGNVRIIDFTLRRGDLYIDSENNLIYITIADLINPYSEPGSKIQEGRVSLLSEKGQKLSSISLTLNYSGTADIMYDEEEKNQKFGQATTPYRISIENKGDADSEGTPEINIKQAS